jgi:hypothetical protein
MIAYSVSQQQIIIERQQREIEMLKRRVRLHLWERRLALTHRWAPTKKRRHRRKPPATLASPSQPPRDVPAVPTRTPFQHAA